MLSSIKTSVIEQVKRVIYRWIEVVSNGMDRSLIDVDYIRVVYNSIPSIV